MTPDYTFSAKTLHEKLQIRGALSTWARTMCSFIPENQQTKLLQPQYLRGRSESVRILRTPHTYFTKEAALAIAGYHKAKDLIGEICDS